MVFLRKTLNILFVLLVAMPLSAKKAVPAMTQEQEEQFLYYFYASRQAIDQQNFSKALVLLDFCEQLNPKDGLVKYNLGIIYDALGLKDKAMTAFAEAYRLAPDDCWRHYTDRLLLTEEPLKMAQAIKIVETQHKNHPKDVDIADYLLQVYVHEEMWKQALVMQDKIDALTGYDGNSAINRYSIYLKMGKPQQAVAEVDRYLEEDPTSFYFLMLRTDLYVAHEQYEEAFGICRRIARLFPLSEREFEKVKQNRYCTYYLSLIKSEEADSLANIGELDKAYELYELALYLMPQNSYALNNYAYNLAIYGGDIKKAERMSAVTIKEDANNSTFLDTYGWILHLQGQDALALFYLKKALENAQDDVTRKVVEEHIREVGDF